MDKLNGYMLVVDDKLNGFRDAFIDEHTKEISVSPAIFCLLQDSDSRDTVLEQIVFYDLNFLVQVDLLKTTKNPVSGISLNTKGLGRW